MSGSNVVMVSPISVSTEMDPVVKSALNASTGGIYKVRLVRKKDGSDAWALRVWAGRRATEREVAAGADPNEALAQNPQASEFVIPLRQARTLAEAEYARKVACDELRREGHFVLDETTFGGLQSAARTNLTGPLTPSEQSRLRVAIERAGGVM